METALTPETFKALYDVLTPDVMNQLTITVTPQMTLLVAIVAYIIQQVKELPYIKKVKGYLPLISMALGVGLAFVWSLTNPIPTGIVIGFAASTGYKVFNPTKPETPEEKK